MLRRPFCIRITAIGMVAFFQSGNAQTGTLTDDGAWCWFSDPRAIVADGKLVTGWVTEAGTIEAGVLDLATGTARTDELYYLLEADDHDNPAFTTAADGSILALYTRHSRKDLFINRWNPAADSAFGGAQLIHPFTDAELARFPRATMSYANPYRLEREGNRLFVFGRWVGFKPNLITSGDNGVSWSGSRVFITNYPFDPGNRPYVKYHSDGRSRIHILFTDGHPRNEPTNSVYYAAYENGGFFRADGKRIAGMDAIPFEPRAASVIYTSTAESGRAWIADISQDPEGNPVVLYTRSPTEDNHEYWYARFDGNRWQNRKICDSGPWFPQTPEGKSEPEPHYFGGMTLHPSKPGVVYLSRRVNGVFEIERWETPDGGQSWSRDPVTRGSERDNVRPYVPRGLGAEAPEIVLWMENARYIHYTDYRAAIRYRIRL